jgi:hypothetical protein
MAFSIRALGLKWVFFDMVMILSQLLPGGRSGAAVRDDHELVEGHFTQKPSFTNR